jgi:DNA-binding NtrC family response regulator
VNFTNVKTAFHTPRPPAILVVDDEECVRSIVCNILEATGYRVYAASSIAEAICFLQCSKEINLAICDIHLSDGVGPDNEQHLLALRPGLPIIWMTGDPYSIDWCSGQDVLAKPFSFTTLLKKVSDLLENENAYLSGTSRNGLEA